MIYFLYNFLWTAFSLISFPFLVLGGRKGLVRLGLFLPRFRGGRENIWVHALSVGEVISSEPVIKALGNRYPEKGLVLTVKTLQGMKVAQERLRDNVDTLCFMPPDFWWCINRLIKRIEPCLMILVETDIWPGLVSCLKKKNISVMLINGRISPSTHKSYKRFSFISRRVLEDIDLFLMQSELDAERLLDTGISRNRVEVTGNIKFDREWIPMTESERDKWMHLLNLHEDSRIIVAGSTHEGEEEIILSVFKKLTLSFSNLILIVAPRRTERAASVMELCRKAGLRAALRSSLLPSASTESEVIVLDTLGELGRIYGIGEITFVGGSMVPLGGHNLLEPAVFGQPVLFGEHTHNFVLMARLILDEGGGKRVKNGKDLLECMNELLSDPNEAKEMGKRASRFAMNNSGALERVMDFAGEYLGRN